MSAQARTQAALADTRSEILGSALGTCRLPATVTARTDGWSTPIDYARLDTNIILSATFVNGYRLRSWGPDRTDGGADDIVQDRTADWLKGQLGQYGLSQGTSPCI
jgi:hypothetical protein